MFTAVILCCLAAVSAYPSGAPIDACTYLIPQHNVSGVFGLMPYDVSLSGQTVRHGTFITVSLISPNDTFFEGFLIAAVEKNSIPKKLVGSFRQAADGSDWQNGPCTATGNDQRMASATHTDTTKRTYVQLEWVAPDDFTGEACFQGAMVHEFEEWYQITGTLESQCFTVEAAAPSGDDGGKTKVGDNGSSNISAALTMIVLLALHRLF